jgi:hypothetical protein
MRLVTGDLWSELGRADLILVTTNAIVTRDGPARHGARRSSGSPGPVPWIGR